jgi:hypothetical protein
MATSKRTRRRTRARARKAPAAATVTPNLVEQLRQLKLNLQATREKLMLVSPDLLTDNDHAAWTDQIFQVSLAINGLRNVTLQTLSDEFTAELPSFESATTKLIDDLFELQQAVDVIETVSGALVVVRKIATLLA